MSAYRNLYEQFASDAAFLWLLRSIAVDLPSYTRDDLMALEQRLDAKFDGLMTHPDESWEICAEAMATGQADEIFAATVVAFQSCDIDKIQLVIELGLASPQSAKGLVSALAWLPGRLCHSWLKKFLNSKDLNHKYLAVAACSLRREDPREYLTAIFQREDCIAHDKLYARALRLVGELKRRDLSPALTIAMRSDKPEILFWASWSAVMLGDHSVTQHLQAFVLEENPFQARAIQISFRVLPVDTAREWIGILANDPAQIRNVIKATAALGDPHAVNWLIAQMHTPILSRLAGEAFTIITGIDLNDRHLTIGDLAVMNQPLPSDSPSEDSADSDVCLSEDERLPFPDVDKVNAAWQQAQQHFIPAQRYLMGQQLSADYLTTLFNHSNQRIRRAAALELSLLKPDQFLLNYAARCVEE